MKDELFLESINQYDTIFVDIQAQFVAARFAEGNPVQIINRNIVGELQKEYPDIALGDMTLMNAVSRIYHETGSQFVMIFDEWDYPIRELAECNRERSDYIEFCADCSRAAMQKSISVWHTSRASCRLCG